MTRLCVSIPVHEELPVVFDQINNIRSFLPHDTIIVLHLSQGFSSAQRVSRMVPDGVYVNPVSQPTAWGNVLDTHNANFEYISKQEQFDYFVMHASNDLYIKRGAEQYIATADSGVQSTPIHPFVERCTDDGVEQIPEPRMLACTHEGLQKMVAHLGLPSIYHTSVEGIFFQRDLFAEMVQLINTYWSAGPNSLMAPEHFYYATAAAALARSSVSPFTYSDAHRPDVRHPITIEFIGQLLAGTYVEDTNEDKADYFDLPSVNQRQDFDFDNIYAVKRVTRLYDDAVRRYIRTLAATQQPAMRLPSVSEPSSFTTLAYVQEAIDSPLLLKNYARAFTARDDATLLVIIREDQASLVPEFERAVTRAGLASDEAASVVGSVVPNDVENSVSISHTVDAVLTASAPQSLFMHLPHVQPVVARRLRLLKQSAGRR